MCQMRTGNVSSKRSMEYREPSDERDFCFAGCAWLLDVLQSSLNLKLRLASQQLSTSHCNYCACSLDIFHKSSPIAKFFLREEKKAKEGEAVETQLQWLIISSLLNPAIACSDQWSTCGLRLLLCLLKTVLIPYWMLGIQKHVENGRIFKLLLFSVFQNSYAEIFCKSGSEHFQNCLIWVGGRQFWHSVF